MTRVPSDLIILLGSIIMSGMSTPIPVNTMNPIYIIHFVSDHRSFIQNSRIFHSHTSHSKLRARGKKHERVRQLSSRRNRLWKEANHGRSPELLYGGRHPSVIGRGWEETKSAFPLIGRRWNQNKNKT